MQLKMAVGSLLTLALLLIGPPLLRADPIRAPTQARLEQPSAINWFMANNENAVKQPWKLDDDGDDDGVPGVTGSGSAAVPEPAAALPLFLLAAGVLAFRKRLAALR